MNKDKGKAQKQEYNKGDFGYLNHHKKRQLTLASVSMLMVVIICVTGIILYHSQKTIFAVMAALAALPAAKLLVGYLVIMPYSSIGEEVKEALDAVRGDTAYDRVVYDVVLSSSDKAMYAGVVFIKNGKIFGYTDHYKERKKASSTSNTGRNKDNGKNIKNGKNKDGNNAAKKSGGKAIALSDIEKHLKFIINSNCNYSAIKMYDDEAAFLKAVEAERTSETKLSEEEKKKVITMNERIAKQLTIYMF